MTYNAQGLFYSHCKTWSAVSFWPSAYYIWKFCSLPFKLKSTEFLTWLAVSFNWFLFFTLYSCYLSERKIIFSFPSCVHVLMYLQLLQNNDFGFNHGNLSPKRHLDKNNFSPVLAFIAFQLSVPAEMCFSILPAWPLMFVWGSVALL